MNAIKSLRTVSEKTMLCENESSGLEKLKAVTGIKKSTLIELALSEYLDKAISAGVVNHEFIAASMVRTEARKQL